MAISPDVKPRVSVTTEYETPRTRSTSTETLRSSYAGNSNNTFGYLLGAIVLLAVAYFAFSQYGQTVDTPVVIQQETVPPVPPAVVPAPTAVEPVVPAAPEVPVPPANPPPTPPAATTTP